MQVCVLSTDCERYSVPFRHVLGWLLHSLPVNYCVTLFLRTSHLPTSPSTRGCVPPKAFQSVWIYARKIVSIEVAAWWKFDSPYEHYNKSAQLNAHHFVQDQMMGALHAWLSSVQNNSSEVLLAHPDACLVVPRPCSTEQTESAHTMHAILNQVISPCRRSMLQFLLQPGVDISSFKLDNPVLVAQCFGIEAACVSLSHELRQTLSSMDPIAEAHYRLLIDAMSWTGVLCPVQPGTFATNIGDSTELTLYKKNVSAMNWCTFASAATSGPDTNTHHTFACCAGKLPIPHRKPMTGGYSNLLLGRRHTSPVVIAYNDDLELIDFNPVI
jgi:hypothetical protein